MLYKSILTLFFAAYFSLPTFAQPDTTVSKQDALTYNVKKLKRPMVIDGNWNKREWQSVKALDVKNVRRVSPKFIPTVHAKMMYDADNIYVIFRVQDQYVRSITTEINGPVWKDSAVEFFFSPDTNSPMNYFNLEMNCGGIPLLGNRANKPQVEDIKKIEIGHSMPVTTDPVITDPVTWTVEYRIPLQMIEKYAKVTRPKKGVTWKGNFYKIAELNSNPHYLTWSVIPDPKASFHSPQFFGNLKFK